MAARSGEAQEAQAVKRSAIADRLESRDRGTMGTLIFYSNDPAILPRVSSNDPRAESWSGLRVDQLSEEQIDQLFRYCTEDTGRVE